jgi:hypothetical protein
MTKLIFCNPAQSYKGDPESVVARDYQEMAIHAFDSQAKFSSDYNNWKTTPDVQIPIGTKKGMRLSLTGFLVQPMEEFGKARGQVVTSNYLFNLSRFERFLPDLEVISISGKDEEAFVTELRGFYG